MKNNTVKMFLGGKTGVEIKARCDKVRWKQI